MDYSEKLKEPRWRRKRLQILERDKWTCKICADKTRTLHVHHLFYFKDKDPWDIPNGFLITLCEDCHSEERSCSRTQNYRSCKQCPEFYENKNGDCYGEGFGLAIEEIGVLLNTIWKSNFSVDELYEIGMAISQTNREGMGPAIDCCFSVKPFDFERMGIRDKK